MNDNVQKARFVLWLIYHTLRTIMSDFAKWWIGDAPTGNTVYIPTRWHDRIPDGERTVYKLFVLEWSNAYVEGVIDIPEGVDLTNYNATVTFYRIENSRFILEHWTKTNSAMLVRTSRKISLVKDAGDDWLIPVK